MPRLNAQRSLSTILPLGAESGKEFARIVDLLLFHRAQRTRTSIQLFDDRSGDYAGLDAFDDHTPLSALSTRRTGFQYKFFPSPFSDAHRDALRRAVQKASAAARTSRIRRLIIVTPDDLVESPARTRGGDVTWFEALRRRYRSAFFLHHWGCKALLALFLETPSLCLHYYPELLPNGVGRRRSLEETRERYNANLDTKYRQIRFIGMSVYKPDAAKGIPMEQIYVPLRLTPESGRATDTQTETNPLALLGEKRRSIVLGDPGSGKSTLLAFLALVGQTRSLQRRVNAPPDRRLPILVTLRRYADDLKTRPNTSLLDHILDTIQADFSLRSVDLEFLEYYLENGNALLLCDGIDELPDAHFKDIVRERIEGFLSTYPLTTFVATSRIVGYDAQVRFNDRQYEHFVVAPLRIEEMERFVGDWYAAREPSAEHRKENTRHLSALLRSAEHPAIRDLASNPLLLTIIVLVHRIDAVLPDERVVLYQKCTETLLNTWHTWKVRGGTDKGSRARVERRNRLRIEAIAHWMHMRIGARQEDHAVVTHRALVDFLSRYISETEVPDPGSSPDDVAEAFLAFVRARAGLLVEIGADQYSFVHLSFQEYLAAAHLITCSEPGGAESLWELARALSDIPIWSEPLRLLIASLRSPASRVEILTRLVQQAVTETTVQRATLLLGVLSDSIEESERFATDIMGIALRAFMSRETDTVDVERLAERLRSLPIDRSRLVRFVLEAGRRLIGHRAGDNLDVGLAVVAASNGHVRPVDIGIAAIANPWIRILLDRTTDVRPSSEDVAKLELLACSLLLLGRSQNLLGVCLASLAGGYGSADRFLVRLLLTGALSRLWLAGTGPCHDTARNIMMIHRPPSRLLRRGVGIEVEDEPSLMWARHLVAIRRKDLVEGAELLAKYGINDAVLAVAELCKTGFADSIPDLLELGPILREGSEVDFDDFIGPDRSWIDGLADVIIRSLGLLPATQWRTALKGSWAAGLPNMTGGLSTSSWNEAADKLIERDGVDRAAALILIDASLALFGVRSRKRDCDFESFMRAAHESDAPEIRAALCIWRNGGDYPYAEELLELLWRPDSELRPLVQQCVYAPMSVRDLRRASVRPHAWPDNVNGW